MIVTIHQPEHLPWLGLLHKIARADLFAVLDTVQFRKNYFQNRNRIPTSRGPRWLTVPMRASPSNTPILHKEISYEHPWRPRYINQLRTAYHTAPYFDGLFDELCAALDARPTRLVDLNMSLLRIALTRFKIMTPMVRVSSLGLPALHGGTEVNLTIARELGATTYLSGPTGREYLDINPFDEAGIQVAFHDFIHPTYRQLHEPFEPNMAFVDLAFLHGPNGVAILGGHTEESDAIA